MDKPETIKWTHQGWFWCCPVVAAFASDGALIVEAKHRWLEPLFSACEFLERARIGLSTVLIPNYEPSFMFKLREIHPY